ncbi:MAG TPA: urate hydroxylase PuuD [Thermoanaerobaculia bacterium]|nr:urate hydroxylase PuuD [Thermoanaerobaculia bacterium]
MPYWVDELVNLLLRWVHVVAAIFWLGQTALFTWMETRLRVERDEGGAELWTVHGGGFYRIEKVPWQVPPRLLHWFKWEAALTWGSGVLLLAWVYHGGEILVPAGSPLTAWTDLVVALAVLAAGWIAYDLLWMSPLARRPWLATAISFALLVALAWGLGRVFTGRAAFLMVGSTLGTIMAANVWMRILPAMRRAVAAVAAGRQVEGPLAAEVARAGARSRHNTFLAIPVVLTMISNHFPVTTYGQRASWALLALYVLAGFAARALIDRHEARPARRER